MICWVVRFYTSEAEECALIQLIVVCRFLTVRYYSLREQRHLLLMAYYAPLHFLSLLQLFKASYWI